MITTFLSHISRRFFRSTSAGKEIAMQITVALIALMVLAYLLALGFTLEWIIVSGLKQSKPIVFLNGLLIYYFIGEFILRYFVQSLPAWDVLAYLHLPIARSRIVNFFLGKSMLNVISSFVFLLFTPFALSVVANTYGVSHAWVWLLSLWLVSMMNHFIVILLKGAFTQSIWSLLIVIVGCVGLMSSDYFGWFKLSIVSEILFDSSVDGYGTVGILFLLVVLLYVSAYLVFKSKLYPEELTAPENQTFRSADWGFLQNFGVKGTWIKMDLKLIFRNKRSREIFLLNFVVFFQALIYYHFTPGKGAGPYAAYLFFGIISSGFFVISYGQFLFSWQGQHFDFTLTQPGSMRLFVESKYWFLASITGLWFLFSIPFVYLGWHILLVNLVAALYNIGINLFMVMNVAMWGVRRIDLTHSGSLNYEGMGAAQWVLIVPFMMSEYIFYLPFALAGYPVSGLIAVGVAGSIGILFHRKLLDFTSRRLFNMRYVMASNFRKDS